jgi:hypothetical protein
MAATNMIGTPKDVGAQSPGMRAGPMAVVPTRSLINITLTAKYLRIPAAIYSMRQRRKELGRNLLIRPD